MRSGLRTIATFGLAATQLAFVPPNFSRKARVRDVHVSVINAGDVYDLINTTDCIPWPSAEVKAVSGQSAWQSWKPENGDRGVASARARHCFLDRTLVFVKIEGHWVVMGSEGLRFDRGALEDLPMLTKG